ncbi:site-specific DNA-methyltransferase [Maricaulis maris]|uniref:site-specific DNA-methyltransferase n=1 Tax=Maricaulis maris TaxID=74318 RepID=UPI003B8E274A
MAKKKVATPSLPAALRLKVVYRRVDDLTAYERNARTHSTKQINQIAASIGRFGFVNPVLVDGTGTLIAGHGRVQAARQIGMKEVPTVALEHLSDAERRALVIADNRLAELAGWDEDVLRLELSDLETLELDFELEVTGFDTGDLDKLLADPGDAPDSDDRIPPTQDRPPITKLGNIWQIGDHRLICGDARDPIVVERLMEGETADLAFMDPPYNVPIDRHVCGSGNIKHREFAMASGEMSIGEFTQFLSDTFALAAGHSRDGAIHFICMDWRHMGEVLNAGGHIYSELKNLAVWAKTNGGMGTFYRSQHELIFIFKVGTAAHTNTFGLGNKGRYRTNVWTYAGVNSFGGNQKDLALHPTVKPVALVADAIKDVSRRSDIVLDLFGGSGSTLIAAARSRRRARLVEIDPSYCDVIIRRARDVLGLIAVDAETGETFGAIEAASEALHQEDVA